MAARKTKSGGEAVVHALTHWLRREVLRCLQLPDVAVSAAMLEDALAIPLSNCNYHMSALEKDGLVKEIHAAPVRGAEEHFYISLVRDNIIVNAILTQTEAEDANAVKAYQKKHSVREAAKAGKASAEQLAA